MSPPKTPLERSIAELFVYLRAERGLSELTVEAYTRDLAYFTDYCAQKGITKPAEITRKHISKFLLGRSGEGDSPRTLARRLSSLRILFRFLQREGIIDHDPSELIESIKLPSSLPKSQEQEIIEALLEAPYIQIEELKETDKLTLYREMKLNRDGAALELCYSGGLRASELTGATIGQVDMRIGFIRVSGKGGRERVVPLGELALKKLNSYLRLRPKDALNPQAPLFLSKKGGAITRVAFWQMVKRYAQSLNLDIHPHMIRHSFATHLMEGGADLKTVQALLGHVKPSTTQIYTRIKDKRLKEIIDKHHPGA